MAVKAGWLRKLVRQRVPITAWLPEYTTEKLLCDVIAGVTVGLTLMPQGLAYATLAGLEPQYGLYSAFMGCFVYTLMGSVKDITIGPTALMALMTYQQTSELNADFAILLCFFTGVMQALMAILHLGVLIDFISIPVTVGFTSATSVIIACSQVKGLLGLSFKSSGFIDTVKNVGVHIHETQPWDAALGCSCILVLLLMRKLKDLKPGPAWLDRLLWLLSTSRNVLVVVGCSLLAYAVHHPDDTQTPLVLTGHVRSGLPPFALPPFSTQVGNTTYSFGEMCGKLGSSIFLVPLIGVLGNVAIAKAFASGDSIDATQEMLTLGLCNLFGSLVSSFPVNGSFSRSAVNHASGVRTPLGSLFTGILMLLSLSLLTPYFYFIPKASLAAVIICAVIFMIEYEVVEPMWKSNRKDLIPAFTTFTLCLLIGVEYGILVGVATNIIFLLYPSARPSLLVEKVKVPRVIDDGVMNDEYLVRTLESGLEYLLVTPGNSLYFPAIDFVRASVGRAGVKQGSSHLPVIVDCRYVLGADFTAAKGIAALIDDFNKRRQPIYFLNPHPSVVAVFKGANLEEFVHICSPEELERTLKDEPGDGKSKGKSLELREVHTVVGNGGGDASRDHHHHHAAFVHIPAVSSFVENRKRMSSSVPLLSKTDLD